MKRLTIVLVFAAALSTALAKKKPPVSQDPPPGHVHSYQEGMDMIGAPLAALDMVKPGVRTLTARECFVSSDLPAMSQLGKSLGAQDDIGVKELASQKRIAQIESGTSILIIEVDGARELGALVSSILHQYSQHVQAMIRICDGSNTIDCRFPLAPVVIRNPLDRLKLKVRVLTGTYAESAGWLYPADLILPASSDSSHVQ